MTSMMRDERGLPRAAPAERLKVLVHGLGLTTTVTSPTVLTVVCEQKADLRTALGLIITAGDILRLPFTIRHTGPLTLEIHVLDRAL